MTNSDINAKKTEIRPAESEKTLNDKYATEIRNYFIDPSTGIIKKSLSMEFNRCPVCHSSSFNPYLKKNNFNLICCSGCEFLFVNPRPTEAAMADFFKHSHAIDSYSDMVEKTKTSRKAVIFDSLAKIINTLSPQGGRLLEVGCGPGLLLETLRESNRAWQLQGVEVNARAVEICVNKKLDVFHGSLQDFKGGNFDLIVYWAVWDHFADPESYARKTYDLLKSGGHVVIGNMNLAGFDSLIMGENNSAFSLPERMNFFTGNCFITLLKNVGFEGIDYKTTGRLDLDIAREFWDNGASNGRNAFLEKIVYGSDDLRQDFQNFLIEHQLSGHMTISARKSKI